MEIDQQNLATDHLIHPDLEDWLELRAMEVVGPKIHKFAQNDHDQRRWMSLSVPIRRNMKNLELLRLKISKHRNKIIKYRNNNMAKKYYMMIKNCHRWALNDRNQLVEFKNVEQINQQS